MMMLDDDGHTPLDCLRSYWTSTNVDSGVDLLNILQSSGMLPIFFAANQTAPVQITARDRASTRLPWNPELSAGVSRLTVGAPTRHAAGELKSTYIKAGSRIVPI
jgi:hypothetical protein